MNYLKAEHLKFKRTISNKLLFIAPFLTALFAWIIGGFYGFQYMTFYWWYAFLLPGTIAKLLLERAIMNVVNNALDYSPQDSSISISMMGDNGSLKISVTDAGPGFSQEDLLHAEEQFYMADRSRSSNLHFGMGLFITKSIVQQHGGQLILSNSEKTGGAQVTISIPY